MRGDKSQNGASFAKQKAQFNERGISIDTPRASRCGSSPSGERAPAHLADVLAGDRGYATRSVQMMRSCVAAAASAGSAPTLHPAAQLAGSGHHPAFSATFGTVHSAVSEREAGMPIILGLFQDVAQAQAAVQALLA